MIRFVIFAVTSFHLLLVISAQYGEDCSPDNWVKFIQPIALKLNAKDLNNSEFQNLFTIWNGSFSNYFNGEPEGLCDGSLLYICNITRKCECNVGAILENGTCVVDTEGDFCDELKLHKCKQDYICVDNFESGGKFNHCVNDEPKRKSIFSYWWFWFWIMIIVFYFAVSDD